MLLMAGRVGHISPTHREVGGGVFAPPAMEGVMEFAPPYTHIWIFLNRKELISKEDQYFD